VPFSGIFEGKGGFGDGSLLDGTLEGKGGAGDGSLLDGTLRGKGGISLPGKILDGRGGVVFIITVSVYSLGLRLLVVGDERRSLGGRFGNCLIASSLVGSGGTLPDPMGEILLDPLGGILPNPLGGISLLEGISTSGGMLYS
jgi:hypothetical protein